MPLVLTNQNTEGPTIRLKNKINIGANAKKIKSKDYSYWKFNGETVFCSYPVDILYGIKRIRKGNYLDNVIVNVLSRK